MQNSRKRKILIVEGEQHLRLLYKVSFKDIGYIVSLAATSSDAIFSAKANKPDLVIVDLGSPPDDGLKLISAIHRTNIHLPIIINTGYSHLKGDPRIGIADAFITKSSNLDELITKAAELLQDNRRCMQLTSSAST